MQQQWEYLIETYDTADCPIVRQDELNKLGEQGWELVTVYPISTYDLQESERYRIFRVERVEYTLKRRKL